MNKATVTVTKWTEEALRTKLSTDERFVRRALVRLYERQTMDEQRSETTRNYNLRGFQPCDAFMFTRFAKWVMSNPTRELTPKQLAYCGVRTPGFTGRVRMWRGAPAMAKYAKQLLTVMEEDAAKKAAAAAI